MPVVMEPVCLGENCETRLGKPWWKFCPGCTQKRWRAHRPPRLQKHIEERHTYPTREWLMTLNPEENVVHCVTRVKFYELDDVFTAPLCDTDAQLRVGLEFMMKPRGCGRCIVILDRIGLLEPWMLHSSP